MIKKIAKGGIMAIVGYILSPLSWWNDLVVNFPISWFLATLISKIRTSFFPTAFIFAYWLTNVTGLLLFHKGIEKILISNHKKVNKKFIIKDLIISLFYSLLIVILIKFKIIKPF